MNLFNKKILPKISLSFLLTCVSPFIFGQQASSIPITKLNAFEYYHPQEKLYIHFDKPIYAAGEDIWFKTYLTDAIFHFFDTISKVVYVELFSPQGQLLQRRMLYSQDGTAVGDFHLHDSLQKGTYYIRGYTNYMRNFNGDFFFSKEIPVLSNTVSSQSYGSKDPKAVDIVFFPEGGNLLLHCNNSVAFKATDRHGNGLDVTGEVLDYRDSVLTRIQSAHKGMGVFRLHPVVQRGYKVRLTTPQLADTCFILPEALADAYTLQASDSGSYFDFVALSNKLEHAITDSILIIAQCRGEVVFVGRSHAAAIAKFQLHKEKLPSGIIQVTLFDESNVPRAERLVFVNNRDALTVAVEIPMQIIGKRERVDIGISPKLADGRIPKGKFSLSIYDASKLEGPDYPSSIVSYLLLTSDLKGYVEDPGYYLKDTEPATLQHADLLMKTHGWRRFTWRQILKDSIPALMFYPEQGISISGKVLRNNPRKKAGESKLNIIMPDGKFIQTVTDEKGAFRIDGLLYADSLQMVFQTTDTKGRNMDHQVMLTNRSIPPFSISDFPHIKHPESWEFVSQVVKRNRNLEIYEKLKGARMLKEVEVKAMKNPERDVHAIYDRDWVTTLKAEDIPPGTMSIFDALRGRVAGVMVIGEHISIRGGKQPLFLLDGMAVTKDEINMLPVSNIEFIDVLKGPETAIFGSRGGDGVIAIYPKTADYREPNVTPPVGIKQVSYPGFYRAREFYSPRYNQSDDRHQMPDLRTTLYWNPNIEIADGEPAKISFYSSDVVGSYRIIVEGLSETGIPGRGICEFKIE